MQPKRLTTSKIPPNAIELEKSVLGAILAFSDSIEKQMDIVAPIWNNPNVLYDEYNRLIYGILLDLYQKKISIDTVLVCSKVIERIGDITLFNPMLYIVGITDKPAINIESSAKVVYERYLAREMLNYTYSLIKRIEDKNDIFDVLADTEVFANKLQTISSSNDLVHISSIVDSVNSKITENRDKGVTESKVLGVQSGFSGLDKITNGWQNSDLIILGARPAVGKSAFALNLAYNASKSGVTSAIINLEMSSYQTVKRLISNATNVEMDLMNKPYNMSSEDFERLILESQKLKELPIYLDDAFTTTMTEIRAKAKRLKKKHNLGLLIIDYLQLIESKNSKGNREQEISKISRSLKGLAKEIDIPIIALSQLGRGVESRGGDKGKIPQLSDLRESGAIEQDADMVLFIYRPEYYGISNNEVGESTQGETYITIAKHRNGALGNIQLKSELQFQRFKDANNIDNINSENNYNPYSSALNQFAEFDKPF